MQGEATPARQEMIEMRWLKPRWLGEGMSTEDGLREHRFLHGSLVHPAADGSVLLESGAPMTDGSTAYMIWLRVDDSQVTFYESDPSNPYATAWYTGRNAGGGPAGRYEGRWYAHIYDDGGLRSAKATGEQVAKEAAP